MSETRVNAAVAADLPPLEMSPTAVFQRVGELTRMLHDALHQLGYDQAVGDAVSALPDARARLGYIATLTGRAAERVLSAAEGCQTIQVELGREAVALAAQWNGVDCADLSADAARKTMLRTRRFLQEVQGRGAETNVLLTDIILAQDFHDLTGQVISKVVALAQNIEEQLLKLLLETTPLEQRARLVETPGLAGPVIDAAGRDDVVTSQAQVDDLLESLGF